MNKNKLSAIIWLFVTLVWIMATILIIVDQGELWRIILNAFVAVLSLVNVILNFYFYNKNK